LLRKGCWGEPEEDDPPGKRMTSGGGKETRVANRNQWSKNGVKISALVRDQT